MTVAARLHRLNQAEVDAICLRHERLWLSEAGGARASFANCDLRGLDLSGRDLMDVDFTAATMDDAALRGSNLDKAILTCARLDQADLSRSSLRRADMRGASLKLTNLSNADLFEADLRHGELPALMGQAAVSHFTTHAVRVDLSGANLTRARLTGIDARQANFTSAILVQAKLARAELKGANLDFADCGGADLTSADLEGASLKGTVLAGAMRHNWKVGGVDLAAILDDVRVIPADTQASIRDQVLEFALFVDSEGRQGSVHDFSGMDLRPLGSLRDFTLSAMPARNAILYGLDLEGVCLAGADLRHADLRNANLRGADLRGVRFNGAKLDGADITGARIGALDVRPGLRMCTDFAGASLRYTRFDVGAGVQANAA